MTPRPRPLATFRRHERINTAHDFRRAFDRRCSASNAALVIYGVENGLAYARLGISVSRKKIRRAVNRNRAKRLIREAFRLSKLAIPVGVDFVVVPRHTVQTFAEVGHAIPELARAVARRLGSAARLSSSP